jgi:hypothetical protein
MSVAVLTYFAGTFSTSLLESSSSEFKWPASSCFEHAQARKAHMTLINYHYLHFSDFYLFFKKKEIRLKKTHPMQDKRNRPTCNRITYNLHCEISDYNTSC